MENLKEVTNLLYKHIRKELSDEESIQLQSWVNESEENRIFFAKATDVKWLLQQAKRKSDSLQNIDLDQAWEAIKRMGWEQVSEPKGKLISINWLRYVAAASIIVLVLVGLKLYNKPGASVKTTPVVATVTDVAPGQFKAKLTLADGTTIVLDSAKNGTLVQQDGTNIINKDGKLVYEKGSETNKVLYNTLSTAKAQTYATVLSDGTKVWLNASSAITYPVAFNDYVRKVKITGEAYFEVAPSIGKNGKRPFIVNANGMEIEVLGTHFNVNNYADEPDLKTTLLEGKVKVRATTSNEQTVLAPGEQAILRQAKGDNTKLDKTKDVDVEAEVAWRYGYFNFNNADLKTTMRQLERWYNVEVEYQGEVPDVQSFGEIPREMSLSQVLNVLQRQNVHFKIIGKKVIVTL